MTDRERLVRTSYRSLVGLSSYHLARTVRKDTDPRSVVVASIAIASIPTLFALQWFIFRFQPLEHNGKQNLIIGSAIIWMVLAPALMTLGQTWVESLLNSAVVDANDANLNLDDLFDHLELVDRWSLLTSTGFSVVVMFAFLSTQDEISDYIGVEQLSAWEIARGLFLFAYVGFTSGEGVWGIAKTLVLENQMTKIRWPWYPFEPLPIDSLQKLGRYSYTTALLFSAGVLFLPATLSVWISGDQLATRIAAMIGSGVLVFGSTVLAIYPYRRLKKLEALQRSFGLYEARRLVERHLPQNLVRRKSISDSSDQCGKTCSIDLSSALELWKAIKFEPVSPTDSLTKFLRQLGSTLIIPIVVALISALLIRR